MDEFIKNIFKDIDKNIKLDEQQIKIIKENNKNIIVIAGAGSGKTTTMSAKVNYMVNYLKIPSSQILLISFTNKAVDELKDYINKKMNLDIDILTFHKLAINILKENDIKYNILSNVDDLLFNIIINNKQSNKIIRYLWKKKGIRKKFKKSFNNYKTLTNYTVENLKLYKISDIKMCKCGKKDKYFNYLLDIKEELEKVKKENNLYDFDDLIIKATDLITDNNIKYKYIIIDEYQDISMIRYKMIDKFKNRCKIIVVGDDWQSIYSFAGSDVNLFLNFKKDFLAEEIVIYNTYRNSQNLIDIVGAFVMKDKSLIKKNLSSLKEIKFPIKLTKNLECSIDYLIKTYGEDKTILILGRFSKDINILNKNFKISGTQITYNKYRKVKITFMTIHSSKGLGYDNVILLNNDNKEYSFPPKIEQDYFKKKYFGVGNNLLEERRLFYVALTRTKNEVHIFYLNKKSIFIKEIEKEVKLLRI